MGEAVQTYEESVCAMNMITVMADVISKVSASKILAAFQLSFTVGFPALSWRVCGTLPCYQGLQLFSEPIMGRQIKNKTKF